MSQAIRAHLEALYGPERAAPAYARLAATLAEFARAHPELARPAGERLTERDAVLLTYGDQVRAEGEPPLATLARLLDGPLRGLTSAVHILPFYPYSSDDGFSVIDYTAVDPQLGGWGEIERLRGRARLMFDAVVNHVSAQSAWFAAFLRGEPGAERRFICMDPSTDLSLVTRPRTTPLLTPFDTPAGTRYVWTTFSDDQIDLNYAEPALMLEMIDVLLEYVARGAELIRLDAIGYLWKQPGTRCIHLPQTHRAVQLFRSVLDAVAPGVLLVTETNVPHRDNISYFGDGTNEAQMVYQFPLAPLVLHSFATGSARALTGWAAGLGAPAPSTTFFNFLASHDGIGVVPASGMLTPAEVAALAARAEAHGGHVSYKNNPDGTQSPYELNITLFDALTHPDEQRASPSRAIERFVATNAIMLALQGVPGIYIHSLFGSPNYHAGVAASGRARSINREKWHFAELAARLEDPGSRASTVLARFRALLAARAAQRAFHPGAPQRVLALDDSAFVVLRGQASAAVLCAHNLSGAPMRLRLRAADLPELAGSPLADLLSGQVVAPAGWAECAIELAPYQVLWAS